MKIIAVVLSIGLSLAGCSRAPEPAATPASTTGSSGMQMNQAQTTTMGAPESISQAEPAKTASAAGTVKSIDSARGVIVLEHGPVEALGWPGMTMAFKATPEQIASVKEGEKVRFEFESRGMDATLTRLALEP